MKFINRSKAPKLPRFIAPKNMASKIYLDKKRKQKSRRFLNKLVNFL